MATPQTAAGDGFCIFTKRPNGPFKFQLFRDHQLRVMWQDTIRREMFLPVACWGTYINWCASVSKHWNVVVLVSSLANGKHWEKAGASLVSGSDLSAAVSKLRTSAKGNFIAFPQRYDGVDLPDDACRILVIDGLPLGESIIDRHDSSFSESEESRRNIIYRIEQGMGRSVRSHVDYAVVLLVGDPLVSFVARRGVLENMTPRTRAQLEKVQELAKIAAEDKNEEPQNAFHTMALQCLNRDTGWKDYYDEHVRKATHTIPVILENRIHLAHAERQAWDRALANDTTTAANLLDAAINAYAQEKKQKGWYFQIKASYLHELDPAKAVELQRSAFDYNISVHCPPEIAKRPSDPGRYDIASRALEWCKNFTNLNGAVAAIQGLKASLSYDVSPYSFEAALEELGETLTTGSSRPEYSFGQGPDNLWLWPELSLVIEAKTENVNSLHKKDSGQLLNSLAWFERSYPTRPSPIPIVVSKVVVADSDSEFPEATRIITPHKLGSLLDAIESFIANLKAKPLEAWTAREVEEKMRSIGLLPEQFIGKYTEALKRSR